MHSSPPLPPTCSFSSACLNLQVWLSAGKKTTHDVSDSERSPHSSSGSPWAQSDSIQAISVPSKPTRELILLVHNWYEEPKTQLKEAHTRVHCNKHASEKAPGAAGTSSPTRRPGRAGLLGARLSPAPYLLGDLEPGFLQAEDGTAVEGGGDLQHGVVVVQAAADVRHGHPLLDGAHPRVDLLVAQDLRRYQVTDLQEDNSPSPESQGQQPPRSATSSPAFFFFTKFPFFTRFPFAAAAIGAEEPARLCHEAPHLRWFPRAPSTPRAPTEADKTCRPQPWPAPGQVWLCCCSCALSLPAGRTYVVEVFCVFHDVRSPLVLLQLHPALPKELPAKDNVHSEAPSPPSRSTQALPALGVAGTPRLGSRWTLQVGGADQGTGGDPPGHLGHLLVRDFLEDEVIEQRQLLRYFQSRVIFKRLCFDPLGLNSKGDN